MSLQKKKSLWVGILRTDVNVDSSPACQRASEVTETALHEARHEIVEIDLPSPTKLYD